MSNVQQSPIHVLVYGESGSGKTTFASSFPKPMLVWLFDPPGKGMPYKRRGSRSEEGIDQDLGIRVTNVFGPDDSLLIQVEHYLDPNPQRPSAYKLFRERLSGFEDEFEWWQTVVLDSLTFCELASRWDHQHRLNPSAKDGRQWYGGAKEDMEQLLMGRIPAYPMNVVVTAHIDEEKDEVHGMMVRNPSVVGKLRKFASAAFAEFYHSFVTADDKGNRIYALQTQGDRFFNAASQIPAPNPCLSDYQALFAEEERG